MAQRVRKELWLGLVIFPAALAVGKAIEFVLDPEMLARAADYQRQFTSDLLLFNPVTFVLRIWQTAVATAEANSISWPSPSNSDGWWELPLQAVVLILRLPIVVASTVLSVIASVWANDTLLASILVTISFVIAFGFGLSFAIDRGDRMGPWAWIPATGITYLVGTVVCTVLWALTWLGLTLFGWFTSFAGFCALCGGPVTLAYLGAVQYASFRGAHTAEKALAAVGEKPAAGEH